MFKRWKGRDEVLTDIARSEHAIGGIKEALCASTDLRATYRLLYGSLRQPMQKRVRYLCGLQVRADGEIRSTEIVGVQRKAYAGMEG